MDESAALMGLAAGTVLWDMEKFYDSVRVSALCHEALKLKFPALLLALGLQVHLAPRTCKAEGHCGAPIQPSNGIVAGCGQANDFARILLHSILQRAQCTKELSIMMLTCQQYVDDITQRAEGTEAQLLAALPKAALTLHAQLEAIGCVISKKTVATASSARLAAMLDDAYRAHGLAVRSVPVAKDLGITATGGSRRRTSVLAKRLAKAMLRSLRLRRLTRVAGRAKKLQRGAVYSVLAYGTETMGIAPCALRRIRSHAARTGGVPGVRLCTTTAIALGHGPGQDPAVLILQQAVEQWYKLWQGHPELHARMARAWQLAKRAIDLSRRAWQVAKGPISTLIVSLAQYGWQPSQHDCWIDPMGQAWAFAPNANIKPFLQHLGSTIQSHHWRQAARGWNGQGLLEGFNHNLFIKKVLALQQQGDNRGASLLKCVGAGGAWLRARRKAMGLMDADVCPLCNREPHTDLHAIWFCPATCSLADQRVHNSLGLVHAAAAGAANYPCFWLRGLVPAGMLQPPDMPGLQSWCIGSPPADQGELGIYLDGSGGPHGSEPLLRRCGWGYVLIIVNNEGQPQVAYARFGTLPGDQGLQTVPRSEMRAGIEAARDLPGPLRLFSDCSTFVRGHSMGAHLTSGLANDDLWEEWWAVLLARQHPVSLTKVKAHATKDHLLLGTTTRMHLLGNCMADLVAGHGADQNQFPAAYVAEVQLLGQQANLVMDRICAAFSLHWAFQGNDVQVGKQLGIASAGRSPQHRAARAGHALVRCTRGWKCTSCMLTTSKANFAAWVRGGPCKGPPKLGQAPPAQMGLHLSHSIMYMRGIWWCQACGAFAITVARTLRSACTRVPTYSGHAALKRLAKGLTPVPRLEWPLAT